MSPKKNTTTIVLLYGPPSSGKGTHARLLAEHTGFSKLEPAHIFRQIASDKHDKWYHYIGDKINNGYPTPSDAYKKIVGEEITKLLSSQTSFILDKPGGSLVNEVKWFLKLISQYDTKVFLFVLDIPLVESLKRIAERYFILSTGESYITYEEALLHCKNAETPIKRHDDLDIKKVKRRYNLLYASKKDRVIELFKHSGAKITHINGLDDILTVQQKLRTTIV